MNYEFVVKGEASESDTDEEAFYSENNENISKENESNQKNIRAVIVDGEAPESDDDSSMPRKLTLKPVTSPIIDNNVTAPMDQNTVMNSILHQKLCECNLSLWNHLNQFVQQTTAAASKKLSATDQMLMQSQVSLQAASKQIQKVNELSTQLLDKNSQFITANFLPNIKNPD